MCCSVAHAPIGINSHAWIALYGTVHSLWGDLMMRFVNHRELRNQITAVRKSEKGSERVSRKSI